ncbi:diphosphoinositol polyphosphate phosphohydrolase 1 [Plakobranchus ocellatus]|uniref:diphosphoinositol-polyphosphate diphosphatase n=1 Tax=Plakobranchus ocellatus TaxID=259542 RepID=A0AAV3YYA2_9GAST|nr:diphosphoinositol polyphosphate phosphohydrolase 1 [Plakobranchus ocellatus]
MKVRQEGDEKRTYDPDGLTRRASCLCFRDETEKEILLITSTSDACKWLVPGGGINAGEEPKDAAVREAREEAGVVGIVGRLLGIFENKDKKTRTWVFAFYVKQLEDQWAEAKIRKRQWHNLADAKRILQVHKPIQATYISVMDGTNEPS